MNRICCSRLANHLLPVDSLRICPLSNFVSLWSISNNKSTNSSLENLKIPKNFLNKESKRPPPPPSPPKSSSRQSRRNSSSQPQSRNYDSSQIVQIKIPKQFLAKNIDSPPKDSSPSRPSKKIEMKIAKRFLIDNESNIRKHSIPTNKSTHREANKPSPSPPTPQSSTYKTHKVSQHEQIQESTKKSILPQQKMSKKKNEEVIFKPLNVETSMADSGGNVGAELVGELNNSTFFFTALHCDSETPKTGIKSIKCLI